jgi:ribonuclease D
MTSATTRGSSRPRGVTLGNADDTAVLARMLGEPATGLASLLGKRFDIALDKRFQQHDWARRPLRDDALAYLAGDVANLGRLFASLSAETRAQDIEDEVDCETAWCLRRALEDATDEERLRRPPFARIKGYRELRGVARAVLREVAEDRERIAEARDPPHRPGAPQRHGAGHRPRAPPQTAPRCSRSPARPTPTPRGRTSGWRPPREGWRRPR